MAVDKNFIVKNGLEVKSNLIVADSSLDSVGIGTSYIKEKLHVIGGVGATTLYVGGIGTVHVATGNTARYDNISISGISTALESTILGITSTKNLTVSGVSTFQTGFTTNLTARSLTVTGVSTFAGAIADATITSLKAPTGVSTNFTATNLRVTGITTISDDLTFKGASANITFDQSTDDLIWQDNAKAIFGTGGDIEVFHNGTNSYFDNNTGDIYIRNNVDSDVGGNIYISAMSGETSISCIHDAEVALYYNNQRKFRTVSDGCEINSEEGGDAILALIADEGDDNADYWRIKSSTGGTFGIDSYASGSWSNKVSVSSAGAVTATSFVGDVTGDLTGTADLATSVTVTANNSTNETVYPIFVDGATGTQGAESDTGLTYNPSTGNLTATTFTGNVSGTIDTATNATNVTVSANNSTDETVYPIFVDGATGNQGAESDTGLTYNPSTGTLTSTLFSGNVNITDNGGQNETVYPTFVDGATGAQGLETQSGLTYNPNTGNLTAGKFTGDGSDLTNINIGGAGSKFIQNQTGIVTTSNVGFGTTSAYNALTVIGNASVSGVATVGGVVTVGGLKLGDGEIAKFGASSDLQVYHENSGHTSRLMAYNDRVIDICYNETSSGLKKSFIEMYPNGGSVNIRHGGTTVLNTTTVGVNVAGNVDCNSFNNAGISTLTGAVTASGGVDLNGSVLTLDADADTTITADTDDQIDIAFGGSDRITLTAGSIDLKNSGSVSNIKLYCESSNAHYTQLQSAAHSAYSGNVTVTLPAATDTLIGKATTDTLTNKTLTSPTITGTGSIAGSFTGDVTGTATNATHVLVTDNESTNENNLITFVEDATSSTGNVGLEMDGNLYYNPSTGTVTATAFAGALTGNVTGDLTGTADLATSVTASANNSTNETVYPTFVDGATGTQGIETDTGLTYNPSTGVLTTTQVTANVTGNVTGNTSGSSGSCTGNSATATEATNVTASANNSTNETVYPTFVDGTTGTQGIETDSGLTYNPSTGVLTTTSVTGNLTGNVTGNCTGSSGSCTGNAATADACDVSVIGTDAAYYPVFTDNNGSGKTLAVDGGLTYNPSTNNLTTTTFTGAVTGNVTGNCTGSSGSCTGNAATATLATSATISANNSTNETVYPTFVDGATGTQGLETDTGFTYNPSTGVLTSTSFAGDGSALTGIAAGGGAFNTSISEYATNAALTTSMATVFTANASTSHRTIVHSCRVTNISSSEVTVSGELYGSSKFAYLIPVPAGSTVELLKKPKVLGASDTVELQCSANSSLAAIIACERQENTDLVASSLESTGTSATDLATMGAAAVIESVLCTNDDGTNDVKATVTWTDGSNNVQTYLCYQMVIPAGASIELLDRPLAMPSGHKLRVTANVANRLCTISAHKVAS